ncbi:MAG: Selenide, water dikinase [Acidimicrobiales bacterium]|nr:Selenide, water dikinase [Acidimicrobiales bacterium]
MWRLADDRAIVVTADIITPVVDDARTWGRIAATNAVSDVYAMGGRPLLALNLVGWNVEELPTELLSDVLAGGSDVGGDCGFVIAGGHTIDDPEPKYGLAVVGEVDPRRMLTNAGLRDGDVLVLSKPLGVGIATTAIKQGLARSAVSDAAIAVMTRSNAAAAETASAAGATGATDVTGFGLLGHLRRMADESRADVEIHVADVPVLGGVRELAEAGCVPAGTRRNLRDVEGALVPGETDATTVTLLADAQTSGGLLFGVTAERVDRVLADLRRSGHTAAAIGRVTGGGRGRMVLR